MKSVTKPCHNSAALKVSKDGVFSGPYFPAFGLNMERYGVSSVFYCFSMFVNTHFAYLKCSYFQKWKVL